MPANPKSILKWEGRIVPVGAFLTVVVILNMAMTMIWEVTLHERVYHCSDSLPFGYLSPGDWVHGEVETVAVIGDEVAMSDADTILKGWSESRLWLIWWTMFGGSLFVGVLATWSIYLTMNPA